MRLLRELNPYGLSLLAIGLLTGIGIGLVIAKVSQGRSEREELDSRRNPAVEQAGTATHLPTFE